VFDPIRQIEVVATPEERVRQNLIQQMLNLEYPPGLIAIEKALEGLPERRLDLLVYQKIDDQLRPLLLVECKAHALTQKAFDQLIGYNHHIRAPYLLLANQHELRFSWYDGKSYQTKGGIPSYSSLVNLSEL